AVSRGKKRCAKRKSIDIAFYFDLTTQPPRFGCIEWYVDNDPIEAGTHPLKSGLKTLRGKSRLGCGGFRHGRKPGDGILILTYECIQFRRDLGRELNCKIRLSEGYSENPVICPKCGEDNSDNFRFCGMCGNLLEARRP